MLMVTNVGKVRLEIKVGRIPDVTWYSFSSRNENMSHALNRVEKGGRSWTIESMTDYHSDQVFNAPTLSDYDLVEDFINALSGAWDINIESN